MARAEIDIEGWGDNGQMIVVCGKGLCFQNQPVPTLKPMSPIPKPPHLKEGQRAVGMALPGKEPSWAIRDPKGISGGQSAGISLITFAVMYVICRKIEKKYFSE